MLAALTGRTPIIFVVSSSAPWFLGARRHAAPRAFLSPPPPPPAPLYSRSLLLTSGVREHQCNDQTEINQRMTAIYDRFKAEEDCLERRAEEEQKQELRTADRRGREKEAKRAQVR